MERMLLLMLNCDLTLALEAGLFGSAPQSLTWAMQPSYLLWSFYSSSLGPSLPVSEGC